MSSVVGFCWSGSVLQGRRRASPRISPGRPAQVLQGIDSTVVGRKAMATRFCRVEGHVRLIDSAKHALCCQVAAGNVLAEASDPQVLELQTVFLQGAHLQAKTDSRNAVLPVGDVHPSHMGWLATSLPAACSHIPELWQGTTTRARANMPSCHFHQYSCCIECHIWTQPASRSCAGSRHAQLGFRCRQRVRRTNVQLCHAGGKAALNVMWRHCVMASLTQLAGNDAKTTDGVWALAQVACMLCNCDHTI